MRRASYRTAVLWVARNDEPGERDEWRMAQAVSQHESGGDDGGS